MRFFRTGCRRVLPVLAALAACGGTLRAEPTRYPLTIRNCGQDVTFQRAPARVVALGQSVTETLLHLGLADRIVGTAVWFGPVPPKFAAASARIERLADNDPSFEAVVGREPDLVAAQYEWHVGPRGSVGKREQFAGLGIPTYVAPADCAAKDNSGGGDGVRTALFSKDLVYREIRDFGAIFDVADRAEALIASLERREAEAAAAVAQRGAGVPVLFWFSSRDVQGDAFVAGRNGVPAYILAKLGARNVITVADEWPLVGWESIAAANPAVIAIARMDRRRFPADSVDVKLRFLATDPVASQIDAARKRHIVVVDAQALNPGIRVIDGIEALANGIKRFGLAE